MSKRRGLGRGLRPTGRERDRTGRGATCVSFSPRLSVVSSPIGTRDGVLKSHGPHESFKLVIVARLETRLDHSPNSSRNSQRVVGPTFRTHSRFKYPSRTIESSNALEHVSCGFPAHSPFVHDTVSNTPKIQRNSGASHPFSRVSLTRLSRSFQVSDSDDGWCFKNPKGPCEIVRTIDRSRPTPLQRLFPKFRRWCVSQCAALKSESPSAASRAYFRCEFSRGLFRL